MSGRTRFTWVCRCDCGTIKEIISATLLKNQSSSCGCSKGELAHITKYKNGYKTKDKIPHTNGYELKWLPEHPLSDSHGYVLVHRLVMSDELLKHDNPRKMHVHHIDKNKKNNSKENLMVVDSQTHHRLENGWELVDGIWYKVCKECNEKLEVNPSNFYERKYRKVKRFLHVCKKCNIKQVLDRNNKKKGTKPYPSM